MLKTMRFALIVLALVSSLSASTVAIIMQATGVSSSDSAVSSFEAFNYATSKCSTSTNDDDDASYSVNDSCYTTSNGCSEIYITCSKDFDFDVCADWSVRSLGNNSDDFITIHCLESTESFHTIDRDVASTTLNSLKTYGTTLATSSFLIPAILGFYSRTSSAALLCLPLMSIISVTGATELATQQDPPVTEQCKCAINASPCEACV